MSAAGESDRLNRLIGLSILFAVLSAWFGYLLALILDVSIAGAMATMTGFFFSGVLIFSPYKGLWVIYKRHNKQRIKFSAQLLGVQLLSHEGSEKEQEENTVTNMITHMQWSPSFADEVLQYAVQKQWVRRELDALSLTSLGREVVRTIMVQ